MKHLVWPLLLCVLAAASAAPAIPTAGGSRQDAAGTIVTVAGNGTAGYSGDGGPASQAELSGPIAIALSKTGMFYVLDRGNCVVRAVSSSGTMETVAGDGNCGYSGDGGPATAAELNPQVNNYPAGGGLAVDDAGNLYIGDSANNVIREVTPGGTITTFAGGADQVCASATNDIGDGCPADAAFLFNPHGLVFSPANDSLYVADTNYNSVRRIDLKSTIVTTISGPDCNFFCGDYSGDRGPAAKALLNFPNDVAVDRQGNLYITDSLNCRVRKVAAATGIITTVAGNGDCGYSGDGGPATKAELNISTCLGCPVAGRVVTDQAGDLFIADTYNNRIREVNAATGRISTIAGTGDAGYTGDEGPADRAELNQPSALALDANGDLYISDGGNNAIREIAGIVGTASPAAIGLRNTIKIARVNVKSSAVCAPATATTCFSVQQNFWITTPDSAPTPAYWVQNILVFWHVPVSGWHTELCYNVFTAMAVISGKGPKYGSAGVCGGVAPIAVGPALRFPSKVSLTATITAANKLALSASAHGRQVGAVIAGNPGGPLVLPAGSSVTLSGELVLAECLPQDELHKQLAILPQLVVVGEITPKLLLWQLATPEIATFGKGTRGNVSAYVEHESGGPWTAARIQAVIPDGCVPTAEKSLHLVWRKTGTNTASFSFGTENTAPGQGIAYTSGAG